MRSRLAIAHDRAIPVLLGCALGALTLAGCGGGRASATLPAAGRPGGTLTVVASGDFQHLDPGEAYYQFDWLMTYATQRPLYAFEPDRLNQASPDLAAAEPRISDAGLTVAVRLKPNVRFGPPVNRVVTSHDVKYAIERGFTAAVPNGYVSTYLGVLVGAPASGQGRHPEIEGIETPDDRTIVFRLAKPSGAFVKALSLPVTAPVPAEYASKLDSSTPSTYGSRQVATGPYMIENDSAGKITGYRVGRSMTLVRNPNWDARTDFRPAYPDRIEFSLGNEDTGVAARRILNGKGMVNGDFAPDPADLRKALDQRRGQVSFAGLGGQYVALNTRVGPLRVLDVRKAIVAATDRDALRLTHGGAVAGPVATHFLSPGIPGFEQAGGLKGPRFDFLANPEGDMRLAAAYMRRAGYPSGRYTGNETLLMVGDDTGVGARTAEVFQAQLQRLGFKVRLRRVAREAMLSRYCGVPSEAVAVCPNVGWVPDFADGQAMLDAAFNGESIAPENNYNWPQLDVPAINAAMSRARSIRDFEPRARAWAAIDRMVTAQAPAVPYLWNRVGWIRSSDVRGVISRWNATWDLSFTAVR